MLRESGNDREAGLRVGAGAAVTFSEGAGEIRASTPAYTLTIHRSPCALSVRAGDREILGHASGPGPRMIAGSSKRRPGSVTGWRGSGDTLFLTEATNPDLPEASVSMVFRRAHIEVSWRLGKNEAGAWIEENFPLKTGGHWFGGNVTSGHQWPASSCRPTSRWGSA